ncbi:MAG: DUF3078 domain-containing protein [Tannerellaceae bacterium]|nr:DUF3078 domain-containing protein [Tannerellaceae bacterium]
MMMKRYCVGISTTILLFVSFCMAAQDVSLFSEVKGDVISSDTIPLIEFDESSLDKINDIKKQFEKQNSTYARPVRINTSLLRFVQDDNLKLSNEALYWVRLVRDASSAFDERMTYKDTIIVDPIFMTPVFRGKILSGDLTLYDTEIFHSKSPYDFIYKPDSSLFRNYLRKKKITDETAAFLEKNYPQYFRYSERNLPGEVPVARYIKKDLIKDMPVLVGTDVSFSDVDAPVKFIPDRRYWTSGFESALQFSQNYVSENWHKGGSSNLNIFSKNYMRYNYNRDKIQITNEGEITANIYNAPKDTLRSYKIGNDIVRLHSNVGYKAFEKWFYTYDFEFITQLFTNHEENTKTIYSAFLSPFFINMGVGMKYDLNKSFPQRHKNLKLSVNIAPLAYTYQYSIKKDSDMNLARHKFEEKENPVEGENKYKHERHIFGPSVRADMVMTFNRNISWQSRFYFKTNFEENLIEFENTLILAITRHFSTRLYLYPRYDDKEVIADGKKQSYFQLNQLLSFGFNYKW